MKVRAFFAITLLAASAHAESPRDRATQLLGEVAQAKEAASATRELSLGNKALERARGARESGDAKGGEALETLALGWAEAAKAVIAAVQAEAETAALQAKIAETKAQIDRERALLEETVSRNGRAVAELREAEAAARDKPKPPSPDAKKGRHHGGGHGHKRGKKK